MQFGTTISKSETMLFYMYKVYKYIYVAALSLQLRRYRERG